MKNYKAVQIQITDYEHDNQNDDPSELGCYYTLIKKEAKFVDVASFANSSNYVKISLIDPESTLSLVVKNLTDKTIVGRLRLLVKDILLFEQEYQQWFEFSTENEKELKVQLKFILLQNDVASPSPNKSSLNNSQQYSLSSNSHQANSSEKKQLVHFLTMGQEQEMPFVSQFPVSPTFKQMADATTQAECENQDLFTLKIDQENLQDLLQKSQNQLLKLQQECNHLKEQNEYYQEQDHQLQLQIDDIKKMKLQIQSQQKEIMLLKANEENQKKQQPFDNALIEQIKKLKNTISKLEEDNKQLTSQINIKQQSQKDEEIINGLKNQLDLQIEKLQRNESILRLTNEQNKYILNLNQKLVQREQELNILLLQQQDTIDTFENKLAYKNTELDRMKYSQQKQTLFYQILNTIQETKLNSYKKIIGPLDEKIEELIK